MSDPARPGFEEALARLEEIVEELERGIHGLDASLELFEEGVRLIRFCSERLDEAEGRIQKLVENAFGKPELTALEFDREGA